MLLLKMGDAHRSDCRGLKSDWKLTKVRTEKIMMVSKSLGIKGWGEWGTSQGVTQGRGKVYVRCFKTCMCLCSEERAKEDGDGERCGNVVPEKLEGIGRRQRAETWTNHGETESEG